MLRKINFTKIKYRDLFSSCGTWPRPGKASVRPQWRTSLRCFFRRNFEISKFSALANVKFFSRNWQSPDLFVYTEELKLLGLFQSEHARTVPFHRTVTV
jgi:hypothetical protein